MSGTVLITGGHRGIGLAVAETLTRAGHAVALASERPESDAEVAVALQRLGPAAQYFQHDLRQIETCEALLDRIETAMGPLTCLVSNAGVPAKLRGDMLDLAADSFDFVLDVNLRGGFFLAQAVARRMLASPANGYRSLIFVTSASAGMVSVERAEYCISKAGAAMMAQLFAVRLAPHGIGVFDLRPGIIETGMTAAVKDAYTPRIESGLVPARRWGLPADIADTVLPLVEGRMAFATGATIPIDGGLSIPRF